MRDAKEVAQAVRFDWHGMHAARLIERDRIEAKLEVLEELERMGWEQAIQDAMELLRARYERQLTPTDSGIGKGTP